MVVEIWSEEEPPRGRLRARPRHRRTDRSQSRRRVAQYRHPWEAAKRRRGSQRLRGGPPSGTRLVVMHKCHSGNPLTLTLSPKKPAKIACQNRTLRAPAFWGRGKKNSLIRDGCN